MRLFLVSLLSVFFTVVYAQLDSVPVTDTAPLHLDTARKDSLPAAAPVATSNRNFDSLIFSSHPFYRFQQPVRQLSSRRTSEGKEAYFYISLALLVFFASIKNGFSRYLSDLFKLFFRSTLKQRQLKEQLMQAPLPSLLLNILFILNGAVFLNLLFRYYGWGESYPFWMLLLYTCLGLVIVYIGKLLTLKVSGWLFNLSETTDAYIFIVFTANKIVAIALLPFIVLLAFTGGTVNEVCVTLSLLVVGLLFIYRYYLSYVSIQKGLKLNLFHFLLYLLAFEIAPLLLINKLLFHFLA